MTENLHDRRAEFERKYGQVWDTSELQDDFTVTSFCYGICFASRKSDNVKGSLSFSDSPRFYFNFREA